MTMQDELKDKMTSNVPRSVLAIGGSLLCLSLSLNLVGIYLGPAINDWMQFKIESAKQELACEAKIESRIENYLERIELLNKRLEHVEKLAHSRNE